MVVNCLMDSDFCAVNNAKKMGNEPILVQWLGRGMKIGISWLWVLFYWGLIPIQLDPGGGGGVLHEFLTVC